MLPDASAAERAALVERVRPFVDLASDSESHAALHGDDDPAFHEFVLTQEAGDRLYGCCLTTARVPVPDAASAGAAAWTILCRRPLLDTMRACLYELYARATAEGERHGPAAAAAEAEAVATRLAYEVRARAPCAAPQGFPPHAFFLRARMQVWAGPPSEPWTLELALPAMGRSVHVASASASVHDGALPPIDVDLTMLFAFLDPSAVVRVRA